MLTKNLFALALFASTPAFANFSVDFEKNWDYLNGDIASYYNGGTAADGTTGANVGVEFVGVSGLSNDSSFTYYSGAPSLQGTAYVYAASAFLNVAAGTTNPLSFYFSTPSAVVGAVNAYSGLNGTGTLLGSFDLSANSSTSYDTWTVATFNFAGVAQSFDLSASAGVVGFDNFSSVPEPAVSLLLTAGLAVVGASRRRKSA